jgi:uncharacterized protein (TIGR02996 family)
MTDEDALIAAILDEEPADLPRLAYADWLEERGDLERAEYLRLEVARLRDPALFSSRELWQARSRWTMLRYHHVDPWWVLRLERHLVIPADLPPRGKEAARVILGIVVRRRQMEPCRARAFYCPRKWAASAERRAELGPDDVLIVNAHSGGAISVAFAPPVANPMQVLLRPEMISGLRSGGFVVRGLSHPWVAIHDNWA